VVYALNQNGWLAFNICREKNLESYNLQKQAFLTNTQYQCFACCRKKKSPDKHYFGTLHRVSINLQSETQKAGNVESMEQ